MSNPVDNWEIKDNRLYRKYEFSSFMDAINFINQVAEIADAMDHHPVIKNVYNTVEFELWSHDKNAITDSDYSLADSIEGLREEKNEF
ncbi:MAG: 4a-hydroxytetrahydrobiopterin dehydratase [Chloroflexi bacterium]|nr:4a-hydroxytetrahydrobiopterin dehydratase [Chloroflexota bacterium]